VGVAAKFGIKGDFELTAGFEIVEAEPPKEGRGVYFELYLMTETSSGEALSFNRMVLQDGREVYASARMSSNKAGGRNIIFQGEEIPAPRKSGQLRITRLGSKIFLSVREDAGANFRVLYRAELGAEDVKFLRLGANPGGGPHAVDLRIHDLRVRVAGAEAVKNPYQKSGPSGGQKDIAPKAKTDIVDQKAIGELITQLGDESFAKREAASKRLAGLGEPAFDLLEKAAKDGPDLEVRSRAADVMRVISKSFLWEVRRFEGHAAEHQRMATRVVITPDGRRAVSSGSGMLRSWDIESGKQVLAFGPITTPNYWVLTLSKDATRVIAGGHDNSARVFDLATGKQLQQFVGHTTLIAGAILLADGKRAITASYDPSPRLWDVQTGKEILTFENNGEAVRCLAVSPDGKMLAGVHFPATTVINGTVSLWDIDTGKVIRAMEGRSTAINTVSFSPDGKTLLDGTLRVWDVASGQELKQFKGRPEGIKYAVFTPDGRRILTGGDNPKSMLRVWDVASGNLILESAPFGGGIMCVAALPDNQRCMAATRDGMLWLWQWKR
jgi:WD40 repeat protein